MSYEIYTESHIHLDLSWWGEKAIYDMTKAETCQEMQNISIISEWPIIKSVCT